MFAKADSISYSILYPSDTLHENYQVIWCMAYIDENE